MTALGQLARALWLEPSQGPIYEAIRSEVGYFNQQGHLERIRDKKPRGEAAVYTDDTAARDSLKYEHESVKYSEGGYVYEKGSHQRDRVLLEYAQTRLPRAPPQDVAEAP